MKRYLTDSIRNLALNRHKMAFVSGPRQVGKTTLAKALKSDFDFFQYKNWDESDFRRQWTKSPNSIRESFELSRINQSRLLVLDEIHKSKLWKQKIKGIYDELGDQISIAVTGSARLNVFKKGGDSLVGRYLNFRLHPLTLGEVENSEILAPEVWKNRLLLTRIKPLAQKKLERLYNFSGFPEPYFANDQKILRLWRQGRTEKIVREDLRDLSRLPELSQIEMLVSLLPERIGSPLSKQNLREILEVSFDTVKRWLNYLELLYYHFEIKPWNKLIARSIRKEPKIYLYDWTEIETTGPRFENIVACHLIKACHYWTDIGEGLFSLHYLRNKEKQEIDFLITRDKKPWLAVEAKYSDPAVDKKSVYKFRSQLSVPFVQVLFDSNHLQTLEDDVVVMSAQYFFSGLP